MKYICWGMWNWSLFRGLPLKVEMTLSLFKTDESLWHSMELAARDIDLYANAERIAFVRFKQREIFCFLQNKTEILPISSRVSITTWLHHLNFNEKLREKASKELHKNVAFSFEQILRQYPIKQHLYGHLTPISQTIQVRCAVNYWRK